MYDENKVFNPQYPFLTVSYKFKLDTKNILVLYLNIIIIYRYDSLKHVLTVKSKTLEENILILNIFLDNNKIKGVKIYLYL